MKIDRRLASMSEAELYSLPLTVPLTTAGRALGIGRDVSYRLAARGAFPVPILKIGNRMRVSRYSILRALGVSNGPPASDE